MGPIAVPSLNRFTAVTHPQMVFKAVCVCFTLKSWT